MCSKPGVQDSETVFVSPQSAVRALYPVTQIKSMLKKLELEQLAQSEQREGGKIAGNYFGVSHCLAEQV